MSDIRNVHNMFDFKTVVNQNAPKDVFENIRPKVANVGKVTASIGVGVQPLHADTAEDLIRIADRAMYAAKQAGRDQAVAASALTEEGRVVQ